MKRISITSLVLTLFVLLPSCKKSKALTKESSSRSLNTQLLHHFDKNRSEAQFIFVRHAEKRKEDNPRLTEEGTARAKVLSQLLEKVEIDRVYSTDYRRTMETATPTAENKNLKIMEYDPRDLAGFSKSILENHSEHTLLIVGHSNTTPTLINHVLGEERVEKILETDYDNLFIVKRLQDGSLQLEELHFDQSGIKSL